MPGARSTVCKVNISHENDALDFDFEFLEATEPSMHDLGERSSELPLNSFEARLRLLFP